MSVYKLFNSFAASADGAASLDVQFDGVITAVDWSVRANLDADDEFYVCEVSFLSTSTFSANDARGSISMIAEQAGLLTSGAMVTNGNKAVAGMRIPVNAGERIYLHGQLSVTGAVTAQVYLHVEDTSDPRLRRRR